MLKHGTQTSLLHNSFEVLARHRPAFRRAWSYGRVVGLVLGELFSRRRYGEARVAGLFFRETVPHTTPHEPYVVGVDGVPIPRSSLKRAGRVG